MQTVILNILILPQAFQIINRKALQRFVEEHISLFPLLALDSNFQITISLVIVSYLSDFT